MSNRILVVEDDPSLREWVQFELEGDGYRISTAEDGHKAVAALATRELPDLVLLDVQLPGINGYDVCRRLKAAENTRMLPVILLTALNDKESRVKGIEAGADDFVSKPPDRVELLARVKSLVKIRKLNNKFPPGFKCPVPFL